MKKFLNIFSTIILCFVSVISCRTDDSVIREIDQTLNIFVDSAGIDMLNSNVDFGYQTLTFNDINGDTDSSPVTINLLKTADTINYLQYVAGAKRVLIDSSNLDRKLYQSKIALKFSKPTPNLGTFVVDDTMIINYSFSPERFQIDNVIYNNEQVFTKTTNGENTFKILK
ncbi:hypothetical protein [Frigoriflavimonas asaccharolytica]|uniref:Uncharacterized protein n=1 Tax=Frigoriflavimonas asaccharolytica TaxID=2735899 RepID=A0A8J8GA86_9FLAO|nr:hypothetical protein [Frigoriflavimonas asaccharolytica]NRS92230.1 hypothetical protein [Frigoriflavimonas asaccharolytica]